MRSRYELRLLAAFPVIAALLGLAFCVSFIFLSDAPALQPVSGLIVVILGYRAAAQLWRGGINAPRALRAWAVGVAIALVLLVFSPAPLEIQPPHPPWSYLAYVTFTSLLLGELLARAAQRSLRRTA